MYKPSKEEFLKLCKKGDVVPVMREVLADFETPLSAFLKIDEGDFSYLLESVEGGEKLGRYSILGSDHAVVIESTGDDVTITKKSGTNKFKTGKDPIYEVQKVMEDYKYVPIEGLPRFSGGLIGYMSYDMVRFFEDIPDDNPKEIQMPDMQFILTKTMLIFDHVDRKIKIVSNALVSEDPDKAYAKACDRIDKVVEKLRKPVVAPQVAGKDDPAGDFRSNFSQDEYYQIVEKAKEHIRAGDIIQMVPSQRLSRKTNADAFSIYRALRSVNPSPYMYYLKFGDSRIIGSSPEILVRCEENIVEVRPIAGTRKRGRDAEHDLALEDELIADPKERAEHIMLVDLGRNDIGRVCDFATVKPRELMRIEKYSHVMHLVSDVVGNLRNDKTIYDLIRATFPAGTVSGAPKIKAMELIDKFENTRRGLYAGCVGYISFTGNIDLCIAIRTIILQGDTAYVQAGGGIVLDSDPVLEYKETLNKAKAMFKAIEFAERGLER